MKILIVGGDDALVSSLAKKLEVGGDTDSGEIDLSGFF
jgi:hypothetical protein